MAHVTKSAKCMSTTGTRPVTAAPKAEPTMAASEIGAFSTRSGPNSSIRPLVTPNGRPSTMSSPMQYTRGSRRISSRSASLSASPTSSFMTSLAPRIIGEEVGQRVLAARQRARLGVGDGVLDLRDDRLANARRVRGVQQTALGQEPLEPRDGIAPAALGHLLLAAVRLGVALEVADPPDRVRLDQRGPVAAPRTLHRAGDRVPDGEDVVAVDALTRDAVAGAARRDGTARRRARVRGGRRPAIVLADEDDGQRPERGEVDALVKRTAVGGAVAEERDDDLPRPALLDRQPDARRDHAARRQHAVGAEVADGDVGDVHRAALAVTDAVGLAVQLGHEAAQRAALGDEVAVTAVRRQHVIVRAQRGRDADGHGLLPHRRVQEARDAAVLEQLAGALLEQAYAEHRRVYLQQDVGAGRVHRARDHSTARSLSRESAHASCRRSRTVSAP